MYQSAKSWSKSKVNSQHPFSYFMTPNNTSRPIMPEALHDQVAWYG